MCYKIQCRKCNKFTWAGCGMHKDSIMRNISIDQRCTCNSGKQQPQSSSTPHLNHFTKSSQYFYK